MFTFVINNNKLFEQTLTKQIGGSTHEVAAKVDEYARGMISASGATLFEELGLYYIGPVDGHNIDYLVTILEKVKSMPAPGPVVIHVVTEKGKGYSPAEAAPDKMHGTLTLVYSCYQLIISSFEALIFETHHIVTFLNKIRSPDFKTNHSCLLSYKRIS